MAFVALLALLKPSLPLLVGAGLAALTAGALAVRDYAGTAFVAVMSVPLAVVGIVLLRFRVGPSSRRPPRAAAIHRTARARGRCRHCGGDDEWC